MTAISTEQIMEASSVVPIESARLMSEADYERERSRLRETYGDTKGEAGARFEQELARLFHRSGWTQQKLAAKEGKSQAWISYRLLFGRFLEFITTGDKVGNPVFLKLTERSFRRHWDRTEGENDRVHFQAVVDLMEREATSRKEPRRLRPQIIDEFADGSWHRLSTIAKHLDVPEDDYLKHALDALVWGESPKVKAERKQVGSSWSYRIFRMRKQRPISSDELETKLAPIIEGLQSESQRAPGTIANATVARLAAQLSNLLKEWRK